MFEKRNASRVAFALAICSVAGAASAANLSPGPYIKAFGGYSDIELDVESTQGASSVDADGGTYGTALGYLAPWGRLAVGMEFNIAADDAHSRTDVLLRNPGSDSTEAGQLEIQGDYSYGAKLMLGGFIARKVLVYGFGGWHWFRGEAEVTRADGSFTRESERFEGPRGGVGMAIPVYADALSVRVEISRTFYDEEADFEPEQDLYTVGFAYTF